MPVHRIDDRVSEIEQIIGSISGLPIQLVIVQDNYFFNFNIVERIKGMDSEQIYVVSGEFGNPGAARNFGLGCVTGSWTAFWDSDDSPNASEFLKMINYAEASNSRLVAGFFEERNRKIKREGLVLKLTPILLRLQILLNPGLWRFAFKTESIKSIKFPEMIMAEDQLFLMKRIQKLSDICL